jgi:transposase
MGENCPGEDVQMEGTGRQRKRRYTEDYKAEVVRLCLSGDKPITMVAEELGLGRSMVQRWVSRWEADQGQGEGLTTSEREELARLRRENRILREERDILRRATAFFAKETR